MIRNLVRKLSAWAWTIEINRAKQFERVRDEKLKFRIALEEILKSATPNKRDNPKMFEAWEKAKGAFTIKN